jgi:putative hydrolase of the HAD superfamily
VGYPWHTPDVEHPETRDADIWWDRLIPQFQRVFQAFGIGDERAAVLAPRVRTEYCDTSRWSLYEDTMPVLGNLSASGWKHLILSNHVPELPQIAGALGLDEYVEGVFSSALTGFEKPNPLAFLTVLRTLHPDEPVVMIGDNPVADAEGAMALGIPAVLVRKQGEPGMLWSGDLYGVEELLAGIGDVPVSRILEDAPES